jgi:hypothetical protein
VEALKGWQEKHNPPATAAVVKVTSRLLDNLNDDLLEIGLARRVPVDADGETIPLDADGKPAKTPAAWRIEKRDAAGRTIDLHALRHTFGTRLGNTAGIDPKSVQTLLRHRKAETTFGIYVHADRDRLAAAVESLPEVKPAAVREAVAVVKTGTDDTPLPTSNQQGAAAFSRKAVTGNALTTSDALLDKLGVTGSSPVAPTILDDCSNSA